MANSFAPSPKYALPRSYVGGIIISDLIVAAEFVGDEIIATVVDPFTYYHHFAIEPRFRAWSSNCYTLDFIVTDVYYTVPGVPGRGDFGVQIEYFNTLDFPTPAIILRLIGVETNRIYVPLPPSPADYWLNNGR